MATNYSYAAVKDKPGIVQVTETRTYEENVEYFRQELQDRQDQLANLEKEISTNTLDAKQAAAVEEKNVIIRNKKNVLDSDVAYLQKKINDIEAVLGSQVVTK